MKHVSEPGVALSDAPSGFRQLVGYRVTEWSDGEATVVLSVGPRHLNRSNIVHAGVLVTLIDTAGAYCGTYCPVPGNVRRSLTTSVNVRTFAEIDGGTLLSRARLLSRQGDTFTASAELRTESGVLIASGEATYRYRPGSEKLQGVPLDKSGEKRSTPLG